MDFTTHEKMIIEVFDILCVLSPSLSFNRNE